MFHIENEGLVEGEEEKQDLCICAIRLEMFTGKYI